MKLNLCVLLTLLFVSFNSYAINTRFRFDIHSSGPSIYACDAGIKHVTPIQERICYDRTTNNACNPSVCVNADCDCVCTGTNTNGNTRHDSLVASYGAWVDNGEVVTNVTNKTVASVMGQQWQSLFGGGTQSFGQVLTSLEFHLGSEQYGAEMYLDVCYRGPQIEYFRNSLGGAVTPNHQLDAAITVTNMATNGTDYVAMSDLKARAEVYCDLQGAGSYVYAADNSGQYDNWMNQQLSANANGNIIGGDALQLTTPSALQMPTTNELTLLSGWINVNNAKTPRYCKVRYYFVENAFSASNVVNRIRDWKKQHVRVCTYTSIEENGQ